MQNTSSSPLSVMHAMPLTRLMAPPPLLLPCTVDPFPPVAADFNDTVDPVRAVLLPVAHIPKSSWLPHESHMSMPVVAVVSTSAVISSVC